MATDIDLHEVFLQVTARLRAKFPEVPADEIEAVVRVELDQFADRPVRDYLEVLTERAAKKRLSEVRQAA
jgi:hypothetical protein